MTTTLDLITSAFRKIGVTTFDDTPSSNETNDALKTLNQLLSSWANESLLVYARTDETFPLTGAQSYTVGAGGDFDTAPFNKIVAMYARLSTIDYRLEGLSDKQYADVVYKSLSTTPEYYNYSNGFPLATLTFYPIPPSSYTLFVVSEKPLTSLTLAQDISLPPGWERALIYNLAMDLAPEYGQPITAEVDRMARESKSLIQSQVAKSQGMDYIADVSNTNNIYSGWYR